MSEQRTRRAPATSPEHLRLGERGDGPVPPWLKWGPYVSDRSWGTVREDYSGDGSAWDYLPHDQARSKAYRWGEDGIAGICDRYQILCFALALWNGRDPILKERLFGLIPTEGNHGEDVKECYFYLDSTPTHSYMKFLYKYPQAEFPYRQLVEESRRRGGEGPEYELVDTCVFEGNRYWDVFVEYAKVSPEDICIRIEAVNRGPEEATLHILPHLWFRNSWAWSVSGDPEPVIRLEPGTKEALCLTADDSALLPISALPFEYRLGPRHLYAEPDAEPLFTDNETHMERVFGPDAVSRKPYVKDAFHRHLIAGEDCVNPHQTGTKSCLHYQRTVPPGGSTVVRLRLTDTRPRTPIGSVDQTVEKRRAEADRFYERIHPPLATAEEKQIQRQALAGMLWTKQIYLWDVAKWLEGDYPDCPPAESRQYIRNSHWKHVNSMRILSMPDKWEYPWFAAWDLAFHTVPLALVDPEFAKDQLWVLLFEQFQHPNGQLPACEWEFSFMNPPVHAWACWRVYHVERLRWGRKDRDWLERCFHKLLINFAWWVNKVDSCGNNVFEGGFLGLDNITVFDRSTQLPGGALLKQADGTGWMGMFCLNLMRIALELAKENRIYEGLATKFFQHFAQIGAAMKEMGGRADSLWDEADGFFYDVIQYPGGGYTKLKVRSLVGIIPIFAVERLEMDWIETFPEFRSNFRWFFRNRRALAARCVHPVRREDDKECYALTVVDEEQLQRMLDRVLDAGEFLSDWGIRSLSKYHEEHPFIHDGHELRYEPAESQCKIMGGNSNWRGPIWFPTSFLVVEALIKLGKAYGDRKCLSIDGGEPVSYDDAARELANRLIRIFVRNGRGDRASNAGDPRYRSDPNWQDLILFHEYFHGDTGAGLGAAHQTGWTGLVATLIDEWRRP